MIKSILISLKVYFYLFIYDKKNIQTTKIDNQDYLEFSKNGFFEDNLQNFFGSELKKIIENELTIANYDQNKHGQFNSLEVPESLISIVLNSIKLQELLKFYIGENVRFDNVYFETIRNSSKYFHFSSGWHTDGVGKRLKLYICLKNDKEGPSTIIIKNSQKKNIFLFFLTLKRYFNVISKLPKKYENDIYKKIYEKDDVFLFDTNLVHRGDYTSYENRERVSIVFEFIDRNKSNKIHRFSPCGPGKDKKDFLIFKKKSFREFENSFLFDKKMLEIDKNNIKYKIK